MKRNGGRRYYRPDDVRLVSLIKDFLYEKRYTIEGVQKVFKEKGVKNLLGEEIQKDFFEENLLTAELDEKSRGLITALMGQLREIKAELKTALNNASK